MNQRTFREVAFADAHRFCFPNESSQYLVGLSPIAPCYQVSASALLTLPILGPACNRLAARHEDLLDSCSHIGVHRYCEHDWLGHFLETSRPAGRHLQEQGIIGGRLKTFC